MMIFILTIGILRGFVGKNDQDLWFHGSDALDHIPAVHVQSAIVVYVCRRPWSA